MAESENAVLSREVSEDESEIEEQVKPTKKRKTSKIKEEEVKYNVKFKTPMKKTRKNDYDPVEEARLERLVFGDHSDIIKNLQQKDDDDENYDNDDDDNDNDDNDNDNDDDEDSNDRDDGELPSESLFQAEHQSDDIDDSDDASTDESELGDDDEGINDDSGVEEEDSKSIKKAAWVDDDDDENCSVEEALQLQGRRFPLKQPEKTYKELLINKYKQLVGTPKWADLNKEKKAGSDDDSDEEILRRSSHLIKPKRQHLRQTSIHMKHLTNINRQTGTEGPVVTSLQFHPTSTVALVAGLSGILSIFQIDGKRNTKLHSMRYKRFPINTAKFTKGGSEIVVGSQRHAHCHTYDLLGGKTYRIPLPHEMTNMKNFEVSPDDKLIAVCGRMGNVYVLTSKTKELVCTLKMNDQCNSLAFSPDSTKLFTHGEGGEIYVWDLKERTCIHRATDDGCLAGSTIAIAPSGQYLATGSKQGVVNVYETNTVLEKRNPTPQKIVLNLVTSITTLKFNPTSEILAMGSDESENAFKMMHFPSATIFSNFPTFDTVLRKPVAVDFSPGSGYLGISNNARDAYLYRLQHYGNY